MGPLRDSPSAVLCCSSCERSFPVISNIPILTSRPREMLMVHLQQFKLAQAALEKRRNLASLSGTAGARFHEAGGRPARMLHGVTGNLGLIESFMKPIEDYLSRNGNPPGLIDWAMAQTIGAIPQIMIPFFFQDWVRTKDFEEAESLIIGALMEHRPDDNSVVILGTGACGLAHAVATHFPVVYGLDLSVPTLLMAQAVLNGHTLELHIPTANWRCVQVRQTRPPKNEIRLVAADVGTLPFGEGTLSAIVTQYLMDVAGNPLGVAAEIQRTLKPRGIWVNFSNPFKLPGDPVELTPPEPSELADLFEPLGLEMINAKRQRFTLWNLDGISDLGHRNMHEVHFFVARKPVNPKPITFQSFQIWDQRDGDSWWQLVPRIIPGREIRVIQQRTFGPGGTEESVEIGLRAESFAVSPEHTAFAEALFGHIDGKHTLREMFSNLLSHGIEMSQSQFRELIYCLLNQYCVISLDR